jgi:hypothetical protein
MRIPLWEMIHHLYATVRWGIDTIVAKATEQRPSALVILQINLWGMARAMIEGRIQQVRKLT